MPTEFDDDALVASLTEAQRLGMLGDRPIVEAIEHSRAVVRALQGVEGRVVDIGSGGGLPGLVIAHDRPDLDLTLVDRRTKRTDFLERIVRRHALGQRVEVIAADVAVVIDDVESQRCEPFTAGTARGFGPPDETLSMLTRLTASSGVLIVTEPPDGDRWERELLASLGVRRVASEPGVAVFQQAADLG